MREKAIIVGLTVALLSSASYALDPLGPPKALLGQGHWGLGLEYAYGELDTELKDASIGWLDFEGESVQLKANKAYANLRYGVCNHVDAFARLGVTALEAPLIQEGDADLAWGLGAAATLCDTEKLDWGLLVQFSQGKSKEHLPPMYLSEAELKAWSFQVAAGPTYQVREDMAVYGGLFFDMLRGEYDYDGDEWDFEENDPFGGFAGLDWTVKENAHWTVELQYAGPTIVIATGLRWAFD